MPSGEREPGEFSHGLLLQRESSTGNSSCLPQLPQLVSAACCERRVLVQGYDLCHYLFFPTDASPEGMLCFVPGPPYWEAQP